MSAEITIRAATVGDLDRLMILYTHLSVDNVPIPTQQAISVFDSFTRFKGSVILMGEIDTRLVASCAVVIIPNLTRQGMPYALIENVVTHKDHRARGYGHRLLEAASVHAWREGCYKIMLMTGSTDEKTHAFYERAGFVQSKTGYQKRRNA